MNGARALAPDVRFGGRWTPIQRLKNDALYLLVRAALAIVDRLPPRALPRLGAALGRVLARSSGGLRRRTESALLSALGTSEHAAATLEAAGRNLGWCLALRNPAFDPLSLVAVPERDLALLRESCDGGPGALVVSAHVGPFELLPAVVAALGIPTAVVVRESYDPRLDRHVDRHRVMRGSRVIHRGTGRAALQIRRALGRGEAVGLLPDLGGRLETIEVPWFGARAAFASGAMRLAARLDRPLLIATLARRGAGYELSLAKLPHRADAAGMALEVARELEARVRATPSEWPWFAWRPIPSPGDRGKV